MECRDFREVADSYLSDELLVETNHDMIAHLEACADCRRELAARRELRFTLRSSFANAEELRIDEQFAAGLRTDLLRVASTASTSPSSGRRVWMAIAACLLAAASLGLIVFSRERQSRPLHTAGNVAGLVRRVVHALIRDGVLGQQPVQQRHELAEAVRPFAR